VFYAIKKTETRVFNPLNNQISFERKLNDILHFFRKSSNLEVRETTKFQNL